MTTNRSQGVNDEDWFPLVGAQKWAVIGRDLKIFERPAELAAYRAAQIHMFLLPNEAKAADLRALVEHNLALICAVAIGERPDVWVISEGAVDPFGVRKRSRRQRKR